MVSLANLQAVAIPYLNSYPVSSHCCVIVVLIVVLVVVAGVISVLKPFLLPFNRHPVSA